MSANDGFIISNLFYWYSRPIINASRDRYDSSHDYDAQLAIF